MIFDLGHADVPVLDWIMNLKTSPATRRISIVAYGPHVEGEMLKKARSSGADVVVARSYFSSHLGELIAGHQRVLDLKEMADYCRETLPPGAIRGLQEFNRGDYFEAHETLEDVVSAT